MSRAAARTALITRAGRTIARGAGSSSTLRLVSNRRMTAGRGILVVSGPGGTSRSVVRISL